MHGVAVAAVVVLGVHAHADGEALQVIREVVQLKVLKEFPAHALLPPDHSCSTVQVSTVQCSTVKCSTLQYSIVHIWSQADARGPPP